MNLAEIERLARYQLSGDASADSHVKQLLRADKLARVVLAMLPAVRVGAALRDTWDGPIALKPGVSYQDEIELARAFIEAVDTLRRELGDE